MKKFLAILLAAITVLSFVGCGNSTAELEELLVSEKWVSMYDNSYQKEFIDDNSGYFKTWGSEGYFSWNAIDETTFELTLETLGNSSTIKYIVSEINGFITFSTDGDVYLRESEFDAARAVWDFPDNVARGTIIRNDGEKEILTPNELGEIYDKNKVKFDDLYFGAKVEAIGTIIKIEENMITIGGHTHDCWEVYNCSSADVRMFDIGDVVIATGTIRDAFVGTVELVEKTTIEHYNG
ncbi:MAG: hypothetical protein J6J15_05970 [Oscillospiraceae bacterium]|nr:hypothetical protein [Oscillospiraceae bacterium]